MCPRYRHVIKTCPIILIIWTCMLLVTTPTSADQFQVLYRCGGGSCYVANATVEILQGDKVIFTGHTDHYGRITINLSRGTYKGRAYYQNRWWDVSLYFDGRRELKYVYLN